MHMENIWTVWNPTNIIERKYFICKLIDDEDSIRLCLISTESSQKLTLNFPGMVYAYRSRLELAALCTINEITDESGQLDASDWTFFIIKNSTFVKEIVEDSQGIYSESQLIHFAVVAGESLIEFITDIAPTLTNGWDRLE